MKTTNQTKSSSKTTLLRILIVILFIGALYLTEISPFGINALKGINGGYGIFDVSKYNTSIVNNVLSNTKPEFFTMYLHYYICDFIFIICFGLFQLMISKLTLRNKIFYKISIVIIALRGIFDSIENIIFINTICTYPKISDRLIQACGVITKIKLTCIGLWAATLLIGLLLRFIKNKK